MIGLRRSKSIRLVEMVMCSNGREDHTAELEWDEKYPLPPKGTRILGLSDSNNSSKLIARHNTTGELYFMSYRSETGYQWQPEFL